MATNSPSECPVCFKGAERHSLDPLDRVFRIKCERCGQFQITEEAIARLKEQEMVGEGFKISAYLREREINKQPPLTIVASPEAVVQIPGGAIDLDGAIARFPRDVPERLDRALLNLSRLTRFPGDRCRLKMDTDYPLFLAENAEAFFSISTMLKDQRWIKGESPMGAIDATLTGDGWNRIVHLERSGHSSKSTQAFVAMSFDANLKKVWKDGFEKAISAAGYKALRVDLKEHNEKICDAIIAEIRKSRFMVADFTGHRGGVYFEAGYALGLGIPVIWTCQEEELNKTHFDTRQYNHIVWKDEADLYERLRRRVEATIFT